MDDLPLLELFTRLRESGVPLGIKDYELALQALQAGYGFSAEATPAESRAALARLCRTLWVRSPDEQRLLDYHFEQLFNREALPELEPKPGRRMLWGAIAFVSLMTVGTGTIWLTQHPFDSVVRPPPPIPSSQPAPAPSNPLLESPTGSSGAGSLGAGSPVAEPLPAPAPPNPDQPSFWPDQLPLWVVWSLSTVLVLGIGGWAFGGLLAVG